MTDLSFSFEYFPPRSEAQSNRFWGTFHALETLKPEYASITWGALGSSSQASVDLLKALIPATEVPIVAHLTCVGHTQSSMRSVIADLESLGIKRFVALRGDQPEGEAKPDELQHASDLVALLAEDLTRDISVAAYPESHPEAGDSQQDIKWLKHKLDKGAQRAITQFFFSADTFLRFRDEAVAAGITQSLVPGILPIHNIAKVQEFSAQCGAMVPQSLVETFKKATEPQAAENCAVEHSVNLINTLHKEGVDSVHLYTLNQAKLTQRICAELSRAGKSGDSAAA